MGLEMLEEFRSITSIKRNTLPTATITTTLNQHSLEQESDLERRIQDCNYRTPPSSPSTNSFNLVCPPPPRKRRRLAVASSQSRETKFFQDVPDDLASIFLLRAKPATASHQFNQLAT